MEQTTTNRDLRILILEDTPTDAELAEHELRKAGIVFISRRVDTRDAFIRELEEFRPDIILSDCKLPDFDGMAALEIMRRDYPEVPVIMVTGAFSDIDAVELLTAGAKDYILKDRLARLAPAVQRALAAEQVACASRAAEKALRESESNLREAQEAGRIGSYVLDIPGDIWRSSPVMDEIFGIGVDYLRTLASWTQILHPTEREQINSYFREIIAEHRRFEREYRIVRVNDGAERWVLGIGKIEYGANGVALRMTGIVQDITERKHLEQTREQYFKFFRLSTDLMCIADPFGCFKQVNPAFVQQLGFEESELISRPFLEFILPEDRQRTSDEMKLQVVVRPSLNFENRFVCKDGRVISLLWTAFFDKNDGITYATARNITELRQAEEATQTSEERLRLAMGAANQGWFDVDLRSGKVAVSSEYIRMIGFEPDEFISDLPNWLRNVHPDDRDAVSAALQACAQDGGPSSIEYRRQTKSGEWKWIQSIGKVVQWNADKQAVRMIGIHTDITGRKKSEIALLESEARFRRVLQHAPIGMATTALDGHFILVNQAFCAMLGYGKDELEKLTFQEVTYPEDNTSNLAVRQKLLDGEIETSKLEKRYLRKDGQVVWGLLTSSLERDELGVPTYFIAQVEDITERKQLEEALKESELLYHTVADYTSDWEYWIMPDNTFRYVSPSCEQISGYTPDEFYADPQLLTQIIHPDDLHLYTEHRHQISIHGIPEPIDFRISTKGGEICWISHVCQPVYDPAGNQLGQRASNRDITKRKKAENGLQESEARFRVMLENDLVGIAIIKDRIIQWANPAYEKVLGYEKGELNGVPTRIIYKNDDAYQALGEKYYPAINAGKVLRTEQELLRKDGNLIMVDLNGGILDASTGESLLIIADITERKRAEELLREKTTLLENVINSSTDYIFVKDRELRTILCNNSFARALGKSPSELYGKTDIENGWDAEQVLGCPEKGIRGFQQDDMEALAGITVQNHYDRANIGDEIHTFDSVKVPLKDDSGNIFGLLGMSRDITEQIKSDDKLRASQRNLAEAQRVAHIGSWEMDVIHNRLTWSEEMYRIFGLQRDQFGEIYEAFLNTLHPDDRDMVDRAYISSLEPGGQYDIEYRFIRISDGQLRWGHARCKHERDADGKVLRSIGTVQDITERKNVEARLARLVDEQKAILQSEVVGFVTLRGRNMVWMNHAYAHMLGYQQDELVGQPTRILYLDEDSYLAFRDTAYSSIMAGQVFRKQVQYLRKDGTLGWFDISGAKLTPDGEESIWAFIDITAEKRTEADLVVAMQKAEAANIAKSRFLATMSHEIRTPMNGILGMAQVLLMPNIKESERQDYAQTILKSGQTLLTLLNDILDLSKVEAERVELESVGFEPRMIIDETRDLFAGSADRKKLGLEAVWLSSDSQRYMSDPHRLRQMLSNLVNNAIKFTEHGHIRIEAREVERDGQTALLEFSVLDTGIGIPEDKRSLLFEPFSQTDSSTTRRYGGTGLGLSIVRSLARLMDGDAGADSEPGRGSRFWFRIRAPLVSVGEKEGQHFDRPLNQRANPVPKQRQMSGRVLVVEDDSENRKVIEIILKRLGLSAGFAEDGQQAVDSITKGDVAEIILMDVQMPVMDGYIATRLIRQWEANNARPRRPIVALTASAFQEDRQLCLEAGMDDVLTKPIVMDTLMTVLGKWLSKDHITSPEQETPSFAEKPLDTSMIIAIVRKLFPLLAQNKFDAVNQFRELKEALAGTDMAAEIDVANRLIEELRFDLALEYLRRFAEVHGWEDNMP